MINTVVLMGRICHNLELRSTPSGVPVLRFQIACDRKYQPQGQEKQADFIDCVAWRNTAEFVNRYFHKGSMIAVEGTLQTSNFTDKNGQNRKQVEVLVDNVSFCGGKNEGQNNSFEQPAPTYASADNEDFEEIVDEDDLPF